MSKVKFSDIDVSKIIFSEPEFKKVPNQSGEYSFMKLQYNHGTEGAVKKGRFLVEFPKCVANRGVEKRVDKETGKESYSIQAKFENPKEAEQLYEIMDAVRERIALELFKQRRHDKIRHVTFYPKDPDEANIRSIYRNLRDIMYIPIDKQTQERIEGSVPSMYLKLDEGNFDPKYRSRFNIIEGINPKTQKPIIKPMDWDLLGDMCVTYTPLVNFYRAFTGQLIKCVQSKMISATIEDLKEPEIVNPQMELAMAYASNPEYIENMAAKMKWAQERAAARTTSPIRTPPESTEFDPLSATDLVAGVSGGPRDIDNRPMPESGSATTTVSASFEEYMSQKDSKDSSTPSPTRGPTISKLPSLPTVPSVPT